MGETQRVLHEVPLFRSTLGGIVSSRDWALYRFDRSSLISLVATKGDLMAIMMVNSNTVYVYEVPQDLQVRFLSADSLGAAYNVFIRGTQPSVAYNIDRDVVTAPSLRRPLAFGR